MYQPCLFTMLLCVRVWIHRVRGHCHWLGCCPGVEYLLTICKAPGPIPSTTKKEGREGRKKRKERQTSLSPQMIPPRPVTHPHPTASSGKQNSGIETKLRPGSWAAVWNFFAKVGFPTSVLLTSGPFVSLLKRACPR
jgi:hypothetical protein